MKIIHTVIFNLKHEKGSPEAEAFFKKSEKILAYTPFAKDFRIFYEVSKKNSYSYGFSMFFENQEDYDTYSFVYQPHQDYVNNCWMTEVADFMEIDLIEK